MLYSLPNGKVIELSLEEYLTLTDEEIQYLVSKNSGSHINSPFYNSSISSGKKIKSEIDSSIDYNEDDDDCPSRNITINEVVMTLDIIITSEPVEDFIDPFDEKED